MMHPHTHTHTHTGRGGADRGGNAGAGAAGDGGEDTAVVCGAGAGRVEEQADAPGECLPETATEPHARRGGDNPDRTITNLRTLINRTTLRTLMTRMTRKTYLKYPADAVDPLMATQIPPR